MLDTREEEKAAAVAKEWQILTLVGMASGPIAWKWQQASIYAQIYHEFMGSRPRFSLYSYVASPQQSLGIFPQQTE